MVRSFLFTQHVRDLKRGGVTSDELREPWQKLRDALTHEMQRRLLFTASPSCLGLYGLPVWTKEAIDELAADCYTAVFLRRLPGLAAQLKKKDNVEGLIFNNIRHFLHDLQRRHDPIGFRVFTSLRAAVVIAVERGELSVAEGDSTVRNTSLLKIRRSPRPRSIGRHLDLESVAGNWANELLPRLVTARGSNVDSVVEQLAALLPQLAEQGHQEVAFGELARHLKRHVRQRWARWWAHHEQQSEADRGPADLVRAARPPASFEERQAFERFVADVGVALGRLSTDRRTRGYLDQLWHFLRCHAAGDDAMPSQRRLAELLDIPRARFPELYSMLRQAIEMQGGPCERGQTPTQLRTMVREKVSVS